MKYALLNGVRSEAFKGAVAKCPNCDAGLIAKCGELRVGHWAHKGQRNCDPWWENETDWHRNWKGNFPETWQEVIHSSITGERHIADVKTENGWVLEFQHSYLDPVERRARNAFYQKLVWVVDGTRRKLDQKKFYKVVSESTAAALNPQIRRIWFPEECRLLNEWQTDNVLVFLDFGPSTDPIDTNFWVMLPSIGDGSVYVTPFSKSGFINLHREPQSDRFYNEVIQAVRSLLGNLNMAPTINPRPFVIPPVRTNRFRKARRHFRF